MDLSSSLISFLKQLPERERLFVLLLALLVPLLLLKFVIPTPRCVKLILPPSPPMLPFIGNLLQLGTLPHHSFDALSKKYGPLMFLSLGHTPAIVISSHEVAREIVRNHDIEISNRAITTAALIFLYGCKDVGFAPYGEYWRQARKVSVLELLSLRRVQSFQVIREEEAAALVDMIRKAIPQGVPVNLSKMMISVTNNIISRCVLGRKPEEENGNNSFSDLTRKLMIQFIEFSFGDFFPFLKWIDVCTGLIGRMKDTAGAIDSVLGKVIEDHKNLTRDADQSHKRDFVHILLQLQKDDSLEFELTEEYFKAILVDMVVGGTDTTFTMMEWTVSELIKNPNKMKKAQEEVRRIVGMKSKIDEHDISKMEYLKNVVKEALRLHPPFPFLLPRETSSHFRLCGYDIPAKTRVFFNAYAIQRDPKVWDRPDEFLPERFENNPVDFKGQDFEFIPFGAGRRGCPGMSFAVGSGEYLLANILYWFDWKLPSGAYGEELDMSEHTGITVSRKNPLCLVPVLYSP